jgi:transcriptional regulator with XRE-family HTH domain
MVTERKRNEALKKLRVELGLSQQQLADMATVSARTVQDAELGASDLSERTAKRISEKTGYRTEWLLRGVAEEQGKFTEGRQTRHDQISKAIGLEKMILTVTLLRDYVYFRQVFEGVPEDLLKRWRKIQRKVFVEFRRSDGVAEKLNKSPRLPTGLREVLQSVRDDIGRIDALLAATAKLDEYLAAHPEAEVLEQNEANLTPEA